MSCASVQAWQSVSFTFLAASKSLFREVYNFLPDRRQEKGDCPKFHTMKVCTSIVFARCHHHLPCNSKGYLVPMTSHCCFLGQHAFLCHECEQEGWASELCWKLRLPHFSFLFPPLIELLRKHPITRKETEVLNLKSQITSHITVFVGNPKSSLFSTDLFSFHKTTFLGTWTNCTEGKQIRISKEANFGIHTLRSQIVAYIRRRRSRGRSCWRRRWWSGSGNNCMFSSSIPIMLLLHKPWPAFPATPLEFLVGC